jgi:hypothetical protein
MLTFKWLSVIPGDAAKRGFVGEQRTVIIHILSRSALLIANTKQAVGWSVRSLECGLKGAADC